MVFDRTLALNDEKITCIVSSGLTSSVNNINDEKIWIPQTSNLYC